MKISTNNLLVLLIKTLIVFIAWRFSFSAIKHLPISVITPFDTINPMLSVIFGIFILNEKLYLLQYVGIAIMLISYYFIGRTGSKEVTNIFKNKYFYFMICAAFFNAVSATIDKIALRSINPGQMQFWFCFFMFLFNMSAMICARLRAHDKTSIKFDFYIPLMSLILIASDRIYFMALNIPSSEISIVMPLRKISILVSAVIGGLIFKEKNLKKKFGYICLLIFGIAFLFLKK